MTTSDALKPELLGYQNARLVRSLAELDSAQQALTDFADREGFALGDIYVEHEATAPFTALNALIAAALAQGITAVAVPTAMDLGRFPRVQNLTRRRLQTEAGLRVLVVDQHL